MKSLDTLKSRTRERNVPVASKPHIHSLQELAKARRFKAQDGIDSSEASFCVYLRKQAEHSLAPKLQKLLWRLRWSSVPVRKDRGSDGLSLLVLVVPHQAWPASTVLVGRWSQVVTGGHRWSQVVTGGHRWSQVVTGGHRWSQVVTGGHRWSQVVAGGRRWSQVVAGGRRWSQVVAGGRRWSQVVAGGRRWSQVVAGGRRWSQVVAGGRRWSQVVLDLCALFGPRS